MTNTSHSAPIAIPLSSLLAPQTSPFPTQVLPSPSAAILGPLPPTTPFHLALNWLALSDLPEYESTVEALRGTDLTRGEGGEERAGPGQGNKVARLNEVVGRKRASKLGRVLVITGRKDDLYQALQEEDEDWMRNHGSDYSVVTRLKRVDMRYVFSSSICFFFRLITSPVRQV